MIKEEADFFSNFLTYTRGTEVPAFFYRFAAISGLGAWLGKDVYVKFGSQKIYANLYVLLLGEPGTKKSTAIKTMKKLMKGAYYNNFAAEKTSKEKFLLDLSGLEEEGEADADTFLNVGIQGDDEAREVFIAADEFTDFFGNNILDFVSLLGVLWDWEGPYENKIKNGQSVKISDPYVSILGGTTPTTFSNTFPQEIIGQGFFSRVLAIHSKPTGRRITWPHEPPEEETSAMLEQLRKIKSNCVGQMTFTKEAYALVDTIYQNWSEINDTRFLSYSNRRHTNFLKMILLHTASRCSMEITAEDVIYANTILHHAEVAMPKAYGEFGHSRNSALTHKLLQHLDTIKDGEYPDIMDLWGIFISDFERFEMFTSLIQSMVQAEKIQLVNKKILPKLKPVSPVYSGTINYKHLTQEEIG